MKAIAFSPCHITGFFQIFEYGSRGAGICISLGSYAEVEIVGNGKIILEGNIGKGEVTKKAIENLIKKEGIRARIRNELPFSQGFGISASSSLATNIAIAHLLSIPYERALKSVHEAEIEEKTGLGDAISSYVGGMEIRKKAGIKGIEKIECDEKILIAIVGKKIETKEILRNEKMRQRINEVGEECMEEFLKNPSLDNLFEVSYRFACETNLANEKMKKLLKKLNKIGKASMVMLGNSIFAKCSPEMKKALMPYKCYECFIDNYGTRILASFFP